MNFYQNWFIKKAKIKEDRLTKFYKQGESILDIGSGNCGLNLLLQNQGRDITGVDIANKSVYPEITPVTLPKVAL